jgi:hypothetical protein
MMVVLLKMIRDERPWYVGPCHQGIVCPGVGDGGDGLVTWRVAVNVLKKSRKQPTKGGPTALDFGEGLTVPHFKRNKGL